MNSESQKKKVEYFIQFGREDIYQYSQEILTEVPQIKDYLKELTEQDNNYNNRLWDEQKFQDIHIPEDENVTNQDICELIYHQLQKPQQTPNFLEHENTKQTIPNSQMDDFIENILFLKFITTFNYSINSNEEANNNNNNNNNN